MSNQNLELPYSDRAERSVLASIILSRATLYPAAEALQPKDFHRPAHQRIFETMLALEREGSVADLVTLAERLSEDQMVQSAGGSAYLAALTDGFPVTTNVEHYCAIVKEHAYRRNLLRLGNQVETLSQRGSGSDEILEHVESTLGEMREDKMARAKGAVPLKQIISEDLIPVLDRISKNEGVMLGIPTGYDALDEKLAGWISGDLVVLAGRPSVGKTALALDLALRQAQAGNGVLIVSLEMNRESLALRFACRLAKVGGQQVRQGEVSEDEWQRLYEAIKILAGLPILIDDRPILHANELRWKIRSISRHQKIKLVIIDYLQLIRAKGENRTQQVTEISMQLKAAARELGEVSGGTLIAVSQLSRIPKGERPQLHHLRESGQIEQDADVVLLLSDDEQAELGQENPWRKQLDIAKQRNGPTGLVKFEFIPYIMGFDQVEGRWR